MFNGLKISSYHLFYQCLTCIAIVRKYTGLSTINKLWAKTMLSQRIAGFKVISQFLTDSGVRKLSPKTLALNRFVFIPNIPLAFFMQCLFPTIKCWLFDRWNLGEFSVPRVMVE